MIDDEEISTTFITLRQATKSQLHSITRELSALVIRIASKECKCYMPHSLLGEGCEVCNPQKAINLIMEADR